MSETTLQFAATRPLRPSRGLRGPLPMSAQSLLLMAALLVALAAFGTALLGDPDTQWHIAVGRRIWSSGTFPTIDLYTHTFAGTPWIAKEWLSQLILYRVYATGGWRGVVLLTALATGLAFTLLHEWLQRRLHATLSLGITLVALMLGLPHFLARPHILVLPVIVTWMIGLNEAEERGRAPPLAFALVMALWANMHGSFPLGLAMAGFTGLDGLVGAPAGHRAARCRHWAAFLAAALAAAMLSPYGSSATLVPLRMETNAETLRYVNEWQPLALDWGGCLALATLAASLVALGREWRPNVVKILFVALLGAMMVRHSRFISLFGILVPFLVAAVLGRIPCFAARPADPPAPFLWSLACVIAAAAIVVVDVTAPRPPDSMMPEAAYRAAVAAGAKGPVLNDYDFGGYLIAHGVRTFVDGRTDQLFLGRFLPDYAGALDAEGDAAFVAILDKYKIGWALVRSRSAETRHLAHLPGWTRIHADTVADVFVRR